MLQIKLGKRYVRNDGRLTASLILTSDKQYLLDPNTGNCYHPNGCRYGHNPTQL